MKRRIWLTTAASLVAASVALAETGSEAGPMGSGSGTTMRDQGTGSYPTDPR